MPPPGRHTGLATVLAVALGIVTACGGTPGSASPASGAPSGPGDGSGLASSPSSVACAPPPASTNRAWWDDRVFYEVFVRSFQDSDGDGIGDLRGLIGRLDDLNDGDPATADDLGITGIWLMPVAESPSYHGYDVVDYRAIDADYGTTDDFRALVEAAHDRGIAVIVDFVMNHTSRDHPWFRDAVTPGSAHDDWYVWADENPGYGGPDGQRVWHPAGGRYYYGLFWEGMPDLNLENPAVQTELDGVARYWLEELGVDGFRLDAIKHFVEDGEDQEDTPQTHAWLEGFHDRVHEIDPDALLVGEVFDASIVSASYVPDAVDLTFDFELAGKTLLAARVGDGQTISAAQAKTLERYRGDRYAAFLTNHDQARVATTLRDPGSRRVAASVLLTNPGVPFLYYGEEIGLTGDKPDERIRTPLPWDGSPGGGFTTGTPWQALEDGWESRNVAAQRTDPASLLQHYRSLVQVRSELDAIRHGRWIPVDPGAGSVYAFLAVDAEAAAAVVVNLGDEAVTDYGLEVDTGTVCRFTVAESAYADGYGPTPAVSAPPAGFTAAAPWQPVPQLPPHSTLVVRLAR